LKIDDWIFADMFVPGEDLLTVPEGSIIDIPKDMTIVDGKVIYERKARK
jgi:predicted amidohydrolase YtcJ